MSNKDNKRDNIHICNTSFLDLSTLPKGYRRIPSHFCDKDKLFHIKSIHNGDLIDCVHHVGDGFCELHKQICENIKPQTTSLLEISKKIHEG